MGPLAGSKVHKFTGKREDASVGLYHFNARYYDAVVGRFLSRDPEKQGLNWYEYARSNPLTFIDPNGREVYLALSYLQAATLLEGSAGYGCIVDDHGNYAIVTIAVSVGMGTETLALSQQHIFTSHDTIYQKSRTIYYQ
jgi:RHS repeat-associated protein